jgi:hypothetical protein
MFQCSKKVQETAVVCKRNVVLKASKNCLNEDTKVIQTPMGQEIYSLGVISIKSKSGFFQRTFQIIAVQTQNPLKNAKSFRKDFEHLKPQILEHISRIKNL